MAIRSAILALFACCVGLCIAVELGTWNVAYGPLGWNVGSDATTVSYVTRRGAIADAGVRAGDKIDWLRLPVMGRANAVLVQQLRQGQRLTFSIAHPGSETRTISVPARAWDPAVNAVQHISHLVGQLFALFALALVYLRPSRMTWAFLLSTLVFALPQAAAFDYGHRGVGAYLLANVAVDLIRGLSAAGIIIFVCRFPYDRPRGAIAALDRAAPAIGAAVALETIYVTLALLGPVPPLALAVAVYQIYLDIALTIVAICVLAMSAYASVGSERQRIIPVLAAYALFVASRMLYQITRAAVTEQAVMFSLCAMMALAMIALAAAVAYGIVRHRVIDVSFAVSRTVVYSILTGIVVGAFALVDFLSSRFLEHLQIALVLEAVVALAFGVWLNTLHARVDRFVDRVLFRRRHLAEARVQREARALSHAETAAFVDQTLVDEAADAFSLASAAVFREVTAGRFERVCSRGWAHGDAQSFSSGDRLALTLRAELQTIAIADLRTDSLPAGLEHPLLAVPLIVRHRLCGFVLYGGHAGGEAIDGDEKRVLEQLCQAAAGAYEHIRAAALSSELSEMHAENVLLKHDAALMREVLDSLRHAGI